MKPTCSSKPFLALFLLAATTFAAELFNPDGTHKGNLGISSEDTLVCTLLPKELVDKDIEKHSQVINGLKAEPNNGTDTLNPLDGPESPSVPSAAAAAENATGNGANAETDAPKDDGALSGDATQSRPDDNDNSVKTAVDIQTDTSSNDPSPTVIEPPTEITTSSSPAIDIQPPTQTEITTLSSSDENKAPSLNTSNPGCPLTCPVPTQDQTTNAEALQSSSNNSSSTNAEAIPPSSNNNSSTDPVTTQSPSNPPAESVPVNG